MQAQFNARFRMWCDLIPGYESMGQQARKRVKIAFAEKTGKGKDFGAVHSVREKQYIEEEKEARKIFTRLSTNLDRIREVNANIINSNLDRGPELHALQKENNMRFSDNDCCECETPGFNLDESRIDYLNGRVNDIRYTKSGKLMTKYGLVDDAPPQGAEAFLERIAAGKYVLVEDRNGYLPDQKRFKWRDPAVKEDHAGYRTAWEAVEVQVAKAKDSIVVLPAAEGLAAVQAFEAADLP